MKTATPAVTDGETSSLEYSATESVAVIPGTPIALGDGEHVWREYRVTQLKRREQGEGRLYVTDSRIIFFATARGGATTKGSTLIQETKLDHVTGLSAYVARKISFFWAVMTAILGLGALFQLQRGNGTVFVVLLVLAAGAAFLLVRSIQFGGSVGVEIHSGASQSSPIGFGQVRDSAVVSGPFSNIRTLIGLLLRRPTAFDVAFGIPGENAEQVISELGALIIDLQSKGSLASERWGVEL